MPHLPDARRRPVQGEAPTDPAERWKFAVAISKADILPKAFQGKPANVFLALDMAQRLGCGLFEICQNLYVVNGTPGFSAKYAIGMANLKGPFRGPIHFTVGVEDGELYATAWAVVDETGERVEAMVDMAMAKAEGWTKNPKYKSMPEQMLKYRAATFLIRTYCPEVLLGMQTSEELVDERMARATTVEPESPVDKVNAVIEGEAQPRGEEEEGETAGAAIEAPATVDSEPGMFDQAAG